MNPAYASDAEDALPEESKDFVILKIDSRKIAGLNGMLGLVLHVSGEKTPPADPGKNYTIKSDIISALKKEDGQGYTISLQKYLPDPAKQTATLIAQPSGFIIIIRLSFVDGPPPPEDWLGSLVKQLREE